MFYVGPLVATNYRARMDIQIVESQSYPRLVSSPITTFGRPFECTSMYHVFVITPSPTLIFFQQYGFLSRLNLNSWIITSLFYNSISLMRYRWLRWRFTRTSHASRLQSHCVFPEQSGCCRLIVTLLCLYSLNERWCFFIFSSMQWYDVYSVILAALLADKHPHTSVCPAQPSSWWGCCFVKYVLFFMVVLLYPNCDDTCIVSWRSQNLL